VAQGDLASDAQEPGAEGGLMAVGGEAAVRGDEGFLGEVIDEVVAPHIAAEVAADAGLVRAEDLRERLLRPLEGLGDPAAFIIHPGILVRLERETSRKFANLDGLL